MEINGEMTSNNINREMKRSSKELYVLNEKRSDAMTKRRAGPDEARKMAKRIFEHFNINLITQSPLVC